MIENSKIGLSHTRRAAIVYIRQSHPSQVENNRESTARQYALVEKAMALGWDRSQVTTIDEDLVSPAGVCQTFGFDHLNTGRSRPVEILLGLEVSRLARSNARGIACSTCMPSPIPADGDGVLALNDRLILGLKGTMSGRTSSANDSTAGYVTSGTRELRRALLGLVWGEQEAKFVFTRTKRLPAASARSWPSSRTGLSTQSGVVPFRKLVLSTAPIGMVPTLANCQQLRWVTPTYIAIDNVLRNPVYAGAYVYGKTRNECYVDEDGIVRKRVRHLPRQEWSVFLPAHHEGFIDWATFEANQVRLQSNIRAELHQAGRALREGSALLQGLAVCGNCGRRLRIAYQGTNATPRYYCENNAIAGAAASAASAWAFTIDQAVTMPLSRSAHTGGTRATALAVSSSNPIKDAALSQWRLEVETMLVMRRSVPSGNIRQ